MPPWTGIVLAPGAPGDDRMGSRVPTYLHPLAGRPLAWHALSALAAQRPAPARLLLVVDREVNPGTFQDVGAEVEVVDAGPGDPWEAVEAAGVEQRVLLADARAPLLAAALAELPPAPGGALLTDPRERPAAAWTDREGARLCLREGCGLDALAETEPAPSRHPHADAGLVVRSRRSLARASTLLRDRLLERHMEAGVTFLLPETVWLELDVRIGRDAVVYPGVVLEGQTTIGEETVVGPGCRIIDSRIGSGVELKGWNYISHTSVRNRAILEPYVRRGFD